MTNKEQILKDFEDIDRLYSLLKEIKDYIQNIPTAGTTVNYIEDYNNFDD